MQRSIKPMRQPISQLDESERASLVNAILSKLGLTREVEEPDDSEAEQGRAPASAVNVIMGRLGLANPASEPGDDGKVLARGLTDPAWAVRVATVQKLGHMGMQAPLELLLVALRDEQSSVRSAAARALSRNPRPAALPALIAALTDSEWVVRTEVARALGKLPDPEALAGLLVAARDPDADVRAAALLALGETGAIEVVELLSAALQDEDWSVREAATLALAQFPDAAAIPPLLNARLDQDPAVRAAAEDGLQHLYPDIDATPPPPSDSFAQWLARIEMPHVESTPREDQAFAPSCSVLDADLQTTPSSLSEKHTDSPVSSEFSIKKRKVTRLLTLVETSDVPAPMPVTDETTGISATSLFAHARHTIAPPAARSTWPNRLGRLAEALVALLILAGLLVTWLLVANRPDVVPVPQHISSAFTIYRGHTASVEKLAWSPDGRSMASADNRGTVQIWQVSSGHTLARYAQGGKVLALNWIDESTVLAVYGGSGQSLQVQEISVDTTSLVVQTIFQRLNLPGTPEAAAWSPNNSTLAFDTGHGEVQLWAVNPFMSQYLLTLPATALNRLLWSPNGSQIATVSSQGLLSIWNTSTGNMVANLVNGPQTSSIAWIACGSSGSGLVFAYTQGALVEWCPAQHDQATSVLLSAQTYNLKNSHNLNVGAIALSANGNQILLATSDGLVQARDATSSNLIYVYAGHSAQVNALAWSPNGRSIASASMDTTVQVWQEG